MTETLAHHLAGVNIFTLDPRVVRGAATFPALGLPAPSGAATRPRPACGQVLVPRHVRFAAVALAGPLAVAPGDAAVEGGDDQPAKASAKQ